MLNRFCCIAVLAIQAKKKRYKAPKARMKQEEKSSSKSSKRFARIASVVLVEFGLLKSFWLPKLKSFISLTCSGSVSSFNDYDEDYEVGEETDDEEQEEPGDYIKGETKIGSVEIARQTCSIQKLFQ